MEPCSVNCEKGDSNPQEEYPHYHLKVARLPVPPSPHTGHKNRQDHIFFPKSLQGKKKRDSFFNPTRV
jgi:hypothetical protein